MKVIFIGVGDAFDGNHTNVSLWVETQPEDLAKEPVRILLDCGFTVPYALWQHSLPTEAIDIIAISHFHGDHYCGLAPLLTKMWLQKRIKDLHIITPLGGKKKIDQLLDLTYPNIQQKFLYTIHVHELENLNNGLYLLGIHWNAAYTIHSLPNLAYSLNCCGKKIAYSGDGKISPASRELFSDTDLAVHEAYLWEDLLDNHGSISSVVRMAKEVDIKSLALVHIYEEFRRDKIDQLDSEFYSGLAQLMDQQNFKIFFPQEMDVWEV